MKYLVAIELADAPAKAVLDRATAVCGADDQLEVVHVVDPTSVAYSVDPTMTGQMYQQMYDQAMADAARRLGEICLPYGVEASAQHVRYGRVAHEVHALLSEGQFDVCMVGSHGRSGWQRILGSKAASILHGVSVDTWVFKLRDLQPTAEPESSVG